MVCSLVVEAGERVHIHLGQMISDCEATEISSYLLLVLAVMVNTKNIRAKPELYPLLLILGGDSGLPCCFGGCRCGFGRRLFQPEHQLLINFVLS